MRRQRLVGLIVAMLAGCSTASSPGEVTPIAGWNRPLCGRGAAVSTPWDAEIRRVYGRMWQVVEKDTGPRDVEVTVVADSGSLDPASCTAIAGSAPTTTIMIPVGLIRAISMYPQPDIVIARILAHELAHVALHQDPRATALDTVTMEYEADELGVYYYERAGFDCQYWVDGIGRWATWGYAPEQNERRAVRAACALAKQGKRPPRRAR
jgi:hypothetical protein